MGQFAYKAIDEEGKTVSGRVEAATIAEAQERVSGLGYIPISVRESSSSRAGGHQGDLRFGMSRVKPRHLILFTKQLGTMIRVGVPIMRAMEILESQTENRKLRQIVHEVAVDLREGTGLSGALGRYPGVFSSLYIGMVHAGESSGALPQVLDRLIYIIEHEAKVKSDIMAALNYPFIVLGCLVAAFLILLKFVVPKFVTVFARVKIELPLPTRVCLTMSHFLDAHWIAMLGGLALLILAAGFFFRTQAGRYFRDAAMMRIPLVGPVLIKAANSRFASIFAILQASGVAVLDTMMVLTGTIGNAVIARDVKSVQAGLKDGQGIARPLRTCRYFTPMLVNMVAIGEEAGTLDEMLREVSRHYDAEVEYALKRMSDAIGPVLIIVLAAVIGFFALAIYMPMWDLTKMVR